LWGEKFKNPLAIITLLECSEKNLKNNIYLSFSKRNENEKKKKYI